MNFPAARRLGAVFFFFLSAAFFLAPPAGLAAPEIRYAVTIHPLAAILGEVVAGRAELVNLLPAGASPHTYEPRPSLVHQTEDALALFLVGGGLDPWAARLPARQRVEVIDLIPEAMRLTMTIPHGHGDQGAEGPEAGHSGDHDEGEVDPHFWTDPLTVQAMLPALVEQLCSLDPEGCPTYRANGASWSTALTELDRELGVMLQPLHGVPFFQFHPSFQYLFHRYDLTLAGLITPIPGREPTPRALHDLVLLVRQSGARVLFSEPQLPSRPAKVLAEAASTPERPVRVLELDPNGGSSEKMSYRDLLLHNARVLRQAAP